MKKRHIVADWEGNVDRDSSTPDKVFYDEDIPMPSSDNSSSSNLNPYEQDVGNTASLPMPSTQDDNSFWGKLQSIDQKLNDATENFMKSNPVTSFLARAGQSGADAMTGGQAIQDNYDTGSGLANGVADIVGTGAGFMERLPGLDSSIGSVMDKTIGQPVKNVLTDIADKYGVNNKAIDYGIQALKSGAEFGGYQGLSNASQGKDVGEGIAEGMASGMAFGAGSKALGDLGSLAIKGIGKVKVLATDGNRIKIQDENGNVQDMNKTIFDNTVQSLDTMNSSYSNANLDDVFKPNEIVRSNPLENTLPQIDTNTPLQNESPKMPFINDINNVQNKAETTSLPILNKVAYSKMELPNTPDSYSMNIPMPQQEDIIRPDFNAEAVPTQQIVSSKQKSSLKDLGNSFATHVFDRNLPLQKINNDSYVKATNSANSGGIVDYIMQKGLVDANGNKVGDSLSSVIKQIPKKESKDFWEYALQKHNIARAAEDKPIYYRDVNGKQSPYTPSESAARVQQLEQQHPEWKEKADNITKWLDNFMNEWGVNTGVVNGDLYKAMREQYPNYIPTNREFNDLEDFLPGGNGSGKKFVNQSTPLKKATGSQRNIIDPTENIMNLVNRTVRTSKYNEVGRSVLDAVEQNPEGLKDLAEVIPEEAIPKTKTDNIVRVLNDGEPTYLKINNKNLLGALNNINKSNLDDIDNVVKKTVNAFKSLITTKNPLFAVSNTARDLPTYLVNSKENNPLKALWNLGGAYKDILTKSDTYNQYKGLGGGSENFFNSEKPYKSAKELNQNRPLPMLSNAIEDFNNFFESGPRLAEFKNTLKKTGDVNQALYDAGEVTTNFAKGGDYTKKIDKYTPYLNAGAQGLSKVARQFKDHPIATTAKGLATITLPTMAIDYMNKDNKNYQALDNRTKDNYFLFPYGDGSKFIKIPKSRELGVAFGSLFERALRQYQGDKQAWKGYFKNGDGIPGLLSSTVADNFAPSSPVTNNILAPLIYNLPSNKDFAGRTIVPQSMQDRSPNLQYDEKTSELAKTLGNLTNLSPKQIDYVIKSYTGVVGQFLQPLTTKSTKTGSKTDDLLSPITSRFTADPLYNNQALQDFYDNMGDAKTNAMDTNFENNVGSKDKTKEKFLNSEYTRANKQVADLTKQSFEALQKGDMDKVKDIRQQIINIATQENKYMSGDTSQLPMPSTEINSNIGNALNKKRSSEAKSIRDETKSIYNNYDLSAEEKTQKLQDLLNQAQQAPQKNPPKPKGRKKKSSN